jgi:hypothetical protein
MGFKTGQMSHKVDGVRGKHNQIVSYAAAYAGVTWENVRDVYYDGQEWDMQLMGNSKFVDSHTWAAFLKCHFNQSQTLRLVGFAIMKYGAGTHRLIERLVRINTKSFLKLTEAAIAAGLVETANIRRILMLSTPYASKVTVKMYKSKVYRYFAKRLVMEALAYATIVPNGPTATRQAATRLNVPLDTVRYWRDLITPDVMVYPKGE